MQPLYTDHYLYTYNKEQHLYNKELLTDPIESILESTKGF